MIRHGRRFRVRAASHGAVRLLHRHAATGGVDPRRHGGVHRVLRSVARRVADGHGHWRRARRHESVELGTSFGRPLQHRVRRETGAERDRGHDRSRERGRQGQRQRAEQQHRAHRGAAHRRAGVTLVKNCLTNVHQWESRIHVQEFVGASAGPETA